jgi:SAM-dependent methyltransferase
MDASSQSDEQKALWNGPSGRAWIDGQEFLDQMFLPFEELLAQEVMALKAHHVLDVGCGTGATTLAAARAGAERALGIDISAPMIAVAQGRAAQEDSLAEFVAADAQTHVFEDQFDLFISRFGVMFFGDPVVAFANMRRAARSGAAMRFVVFRSVAENPFMTTAERAAAPLLPDIPARRPDGPGQFAFADSKRVTHILEASGWGDIDIRPIDVCCRFAEEHLDRYLTRLGPLGQALQKADEVKRTQVLSTVRAAFAPFIEQGEVRFSAACWMICAEAGGQLD